MIQSEALANAKGIITRCIRDLKDVLSWDFLTEDQKETFRKALTKAQADEIDLNMNGNSYSTEKLTAKFNEYYNGIYTELRAFQKDGRKQSTVTPGKELVPVPKTPATTGINNGTNNGTNNTGNSNPRYVANVIPPQNQTPAQQNATKEGKKWWKYLLATLTGAALALLIAMMLKGCTKEANNNTVIPTPTRPAIEQTDPTYVRGIENFDIDDYNIESYADLLKAAQTIQEALPEDGKLSLDQIMYAIKFANWDDLQNKGIFREAEEIYSATMTMGNILAADGINAEDLVKTAATPIIQEVELTDVLVSVTDGWLTVEDFKDAKEGNGYSIFKVLELCGEQIDKDYEALEDEAQKAYAQEEAFNYAKVFSDIVSRTTRNFSMLADSESLAPMYIILGQYNAKLPKILELCAGRYLSTIYGTGIRNDGTYGDICIEELAAASRIIYNNGGYSGSEYSIFLNRGQDSFIDQVILAEQYNGNPLGR